VHPTAIVHAGARIGRGSIIGPHCVSAPMSPSASAAGSARRWSWTASPPSATRPRSSRWRRSAWRRRTSSTTASRPGSHRRRNIFREFVTINRGTEGGGGETTIGDGNLFMAYVHVAHDCHVGSDTIFGPHATLGGTSRSRLRRTSAPDRRCTSSAASALRLHRRLLGVTKDALPYARTIGSRPARVFGVNSIGLSRRGFTPDTISQLKRAYRYLLQSKLNTSRRWPRSSATRACGAAKCRRSWSSSAPPSGRDPAAAHAARRGTRGGG
jgi:UDP-N-acetylglucosamine acyltransferase